MRSFILRFKKEDLVVLGCEISFCCSHKVSLFSPVCSFYSPLLMHKTFSVTGRCRGVIGALFQKFFRQLLWFWQSSRTARYAVQHCNARTAKRCNAGKLCCSSVPTAARSCRNCQKRLRIFERRFVFRGGKQIV